MTADQAFDNLANRRKLAIPVAGKIAAVPLRPVAGGPIAGAAMRVDNLLDEDPGDYHPEGDAENGAAPGRNVYDHPTETDLEPVVSDADEVGNARAKGARVVGRDSAREGADDRDGADRRETDAAEADDSGLGLGRARRAPRFAHIPLQRMEEFEVSARDMAARLAAADRDRPSLAITSHSRGEGRTELAIRLALALARKVGSRILLADFDFRKPEVAARLGISSKYFTVADVLRGACRLGDALVASDEDNLYVLPARVNDREGDEIPDGRQIEAVLADMHGLFDFIVIDCPPALHAGAMIVCRSAGAAAVAGMCGASLAGRMRQAAARLEEAGARVAGMLLTEVS